MNERFNIDTKVMLPISPPGLTSPKDRIYYTDEQVQQLIIDAFGTIFPKIIISQHATYYELLDKKQRGDLIFSSIPVKESREIPRSEVMKLLESWIRIRRKAQEPMLPKEVRSVLMNLKVPDPSKSIDSYRLSTQGGTTSLHILWGYEDATRPSIILENALAKLLEVPADQLISLMSSSLKPNMNTTGQVPTYTTVQRLAGPAEKERKSNRTPVLIAICGAVVATSVAAVALSLRNTDSPDKPQSNRIDKNANASDSRVKTAGPKRTDQGLSAIAHELPDSPTSGSLMDQISPSSNDAADKERLLEKMINNSAGTDTDHEPMQEKKSPSLLDQLK